MNLKTMKFKPGVAAPFRRK